MRTQDEIAEKIRTAMSCLRDANFDVLDGGAIVANISSKDVAYFYGAARCLPHFSTEEVTVTEEDKSFFRWCADWC